MNQRLLVFLLCVGVSVTGCSSMRVVRLQTAPAAAFGSVKAGDEVSVLTADGRTHRFVVAAVTGDELIARNGDRYHRADITRLERKAFSFPRTLLLAGGIYLGVALVVGAILAVAFG